MKKWMCIFALFTFFCVMQTAASAADEAAEKIVEPVAKISEPDDMARADELLDASEIDTLKQAIAIYEQILKNDPDNFEAAWKCAKAYREYGEETKKADKSGWKEICAEYGKKGMAVALKSIDLSPDKPHGYLYYGMNVGIYSDGVGILTALKEGLKDKTQSNFEKAYQIDKTFEDGGPIIALGRYWQVVPWPFKDTDKAEELYREFQKTEFYADDAESRVYLAEILMDKWGSSPKKEARRLLQEVQKVSDDPYWRKRAEVLLADL